MFHPQTNGQSEKTIQVLEDMLRVCVIEFGGHWDSFLPLAIAITQALIWLHLKHCMVGDVGLPLVGLMRSRLDLGVLIS